MALGCLTLRSFDDGSSGPDITSDIAKVSKEEENNRILLFMLLTELVSPNKFTPFYCAGPSLFIHQIEINCALLFNCCVLLRKTGKH
jgi:hypothetical protein